jgi:hypothetical protein
MANENEKTTTAFLSDIANAIFGGSSKEQFIKGAAIGAIAAYLLTNKAAQEAIFKAVIRFGAAGAQAFGDMKDRFDDAKAEIEAEASEEEK